MPLLNIWKKCEGGRLAKLTVWKCCATVDWSWMKEGGYEVCVTLGLQGTLCPPGSLKMYPQTQTSPYPLTWEEQIRHKVHALFSSVLLSFLNTMTRFYVFGLSSNFWWRQICTSHCYLPEVQLQWVNHLRQMVLCGIIYKLCRKLEVTHMAWPLVPFVYTRVGGGGVNLTGRASYPLVTRTKWFLSARVLTRLLLCRLHQHCLYIFFLNNITRMPVLFLSEVLFSVFRDGILGHQYNKRLESFAPCNSQSLLLADRPSSTLVLIILTKKQETRKHSSLFIKKHK
jgi:hypothetical protein